MVKIGCVYTRLPFPHLNPQLSYPFTLHTIVAHYVEREVFSLHVCVLYVCVRVCVCVCVCARIDWIGNAVYIVYMTSLAILRTVTAHGKLAGVTNDKLL